MPGVWVEPWCAGKGLREQGQDHSSLSRSQQALVVCPEEVWELPSVGPDPAP